MTESKKQREEREAAEALAASQTPSTATDHVASEDFQFATEGFDVTQPPPSATDGQEVDFKKSTMPVVGAPADFDPQANR